MPYDRDLRKFIPDSCKRLQDMVNDLLWAQATLKLIPSLPKGTLRSILERDVRSLLDGGNTSDGALRTVIEDLHTSINSFESNLRKFINLKKPGPKDIEEIIGFANEFQDSLRTLHNKHSYTLKI